jgi:hypothetical protein
MTKGERFMICKIEIIGESEKRHGSRGAMVIGGA